MHRALPASLFVACVALAGCSASSSTATSTSTSTVQASAAPSSAATPAPAATSGEAAVQLTGTRAKAMLAPATWFPAGYRISQDGAINTGDNDVPSKTEQHLPCSRLDGTAWIDMSGVTPTAFAQNDYTSPKAGQYAQEIDAYSATSARRAMAGLRAAAARCHGFRDDQTNTDVKVAVVKAPKLGDEALALRLTDPQWAGDTTLEAVRSGNVIVTVLYSSADGSSTPGATKLATYLTGKVASAG